MKKEEDKKLILMQCRVTMDTAERVDMVCRRCGIASRYELMGYLLSCFMRYADPQTDSDHDSDIMELGRIFDGYDDPQARIVTVGTDKGLVTTDTVRFQTLKGKRAHTAMMYNHRTGKETSNVVDILDTVIERMFPALSRRIHDIGRATGMTTAKEVLDYLTEKEEGKDEAWHTIKQDMDTYRNDITYGRVPKRGRKRGVEDDEQESDL